MGLVYFNGPEWIDIWPVFAVKIMGHTKSLVSWARKLHYTPSFFSFFADVKNTNLTEYVFVEKSSRSAL